MWGNLWTRIYSWPNLFRFSTTTQTNKYCVNSTFLSFFMVSFHNYLRQILHKQQLPHWTCGPRIDLKSQQKKDSKNVQSLISVLSSYRLRTSKVLRGEIGCKRNFLGRDCGTSVCSRQSTKIQRYKDAKSTKTGKYENTRLVVGRSQLGRQCGTSAVPRQLVPSPDSLPRPPQPKSWLVWFRANCNTIIKGQVYKNTNTRESFV